MTITLHLWHVLAAIGVALFLIPVLRRPPPSGMRLSFDIGGMVLLAACWPTSLVLLVVAALEWWRA
jgi:hypothetical protein